MSCVTSPGPQSDQGVAGAGEKAGPANVLARTLTLTQACLPQMPVDALSLSAVSNLPNRP